MKFFKTVSAILLGVVLANAGEVEDLIGELGSDDKVKRREAARSLALLGPAARPAVPALIKGLDDCLLYTSPSPRDLSTSRMPSSA